MKLRIDDSAIIGTEYHDRIMTAARFAVRELGLDTVGRNLKLVRAQLYAKFKQCSDETDIIRIPVCDSDIWMIEQDMKMQKSQKPIQPYILEKSLFHEFGHMFQTRNGMMSWQGSSFIRNKCGCLIKTWQESNSDPVRWFLYMIKLDQYHHIHELTQKEVERLGSDGFADNVILRPAIYKSTDEYAYDAYRKLLWEAHADRIADELYEKFNRTAN